jgi:hypothetical protein
VLKLVHAQQFSHFLLDISLVNELNLMFLHQIHKNFEEKLVQSHYSHLRHMTIFVRFCYVAVYYYLFVFVLKDYLEMDEIQDYLAHSMIVDCSNDVLELLPCREGVMEELESQRSEKTLKDSVECLSFSARN